jgi:hypothetical protein
MQKLRGDEETDSSTRRERPAGLHKLARPPLAPLGEL